MHHSSDDSPERQAEFLKSIWPEPVSLEEQMELAKEQLSSLGATGRFPDGKLASDDDGETRIAVGVTKGKVVIHFGHPTTWIGFDPKQAREIAAALIARANEAETIKEV